MLVLGATGWFGRTSLDLLRDTDADVLAVASAPREIEVAERSVPCFSWSAAAVEGFGPTVVLDCAFLTRDRVVDLPLSDYVDRNRRLTARMLFAAGLPSVRTAVTVSSGAAVHPVDALAGRLEDNPYGYLKREAEEGLLALGRSRPVRAVVARAWSVAGAYVQHPRNYALSDMILQADAGAIRIRSTSPVLRRYVLVDELIAASVAVADRGGGIIDSGGELVEMAELARIVRDVVNGRAAIERGPVSGTPDAYYSDGRQWNTLRASVGLETLTLPEQVALTAAGILER